MQQAALPTYRIDASQPDRRGRAMADLRDGLTGWRLAWALARLDLRNRYRGSVIGPFWVTLSTAAMVGGLGLLYSQLFRMDLANYLPHLATSLIVWNALAAMVSDATVCLSSADGVIRQLRLPLTVHALRCVFRNALNAAHSLPLILLVFALVWHWPGAEVLLLIPGLAILAVNALSASLFLGMVCARFRDIGPIVANVMQMAFFLTPVIWKPELLGEGAKWLPLNPFYTMLELVRGPLIEGGGSLTVWLAAIGYSAVLGVVALVFFIRFRNRVAFWV
ncbi:ABC transporter permease [Pseudoroseomonas cervicalis]|uniref:ABC transporter permease n=1 Tax=Teichococcus cervicalis TaxID=204525 RepID=UPI002782D7FA|nr:ABC transporter permease [Pseudoroseomonas cervicalis]MDQ1081399.1 lipopolysaccharide transport system permease protein [Pseudoroseomonas cervicalis]